MNVVPILFSAVMAVCAMLALIQLFLWAHNRKNMLYPLTFVMAISAGVVTILEMGLATSPDIYRHQQLLLWLNFAIAMVLVPMVWSVQYYLPTARRWLAIVITALWLIGVLINFLAPGNLTFSEITEIESYTSLGGDEYFAALGLINPWKWLADITVFLIPLYAVDAAWRTRKLKRGRNGWIIAFGVILFVLTAGIQAILSDAGLYHSPMIASLPFLFVVFALTWVLAKDAVQAGTLHEKVIQSQRETERVMRANLMGEVAAALAHELNQPLAAILGNAQAAEKFLQQPETDMDEIREIVSDIVRDDKRARDIVTNIRNMLRGDNPEDQHADLALATQQIIDFLGHELERNGVRIRVRTMGNVPIVRGGHVAIQQVIINLVVNAERAMRDAGSSRQEIHIFLAEREDGAEIIIRDFGPGIADEFRQKMFEPFVSTKNASLGMGLAVCKRIVENQGGKMSVENAKGGGARMQVFLPAADL